MHLGELEKLVLKYFWHFETADAKQVHLYFKKERGGSLNTIQSTLDRLFKKELLKREKIGHAFRYRAAKSRKSFISNLIKDVTNDFTDDDEDSVLAAFVSLSSELNTSQIDRLEKIIQNYRSPDKSEGSA
jgi:predicted transcriptional regulator